MPVLSIIKRGRKQAKEQNAKKVEQEKETAVKIPYKHVVTHAAADALSGAPSSWRQADRARIMEQNRRRTAMMAAEGYPTGLPRVSSSSSYISYASVYATPIVPLPKNYTPYSPPASRRDQPSTSPDNTRYLSPPVNTGRSKGKEREYSQPSTSAAPVSRPSSGLTSVVSSKELPVNGSSGIPVGSGEGPEIKQTVINHHSHNLDSRSSTPQQSSSSSEKSYRTPLSSSRTTIEGPTKPDRYYPPQAQSTYFSAPRPLNRRITSAGTPTPAFSLPIERSGSAVPSSSTPWNYSAASSLASIGIAIAPPLEPYFVAPSTPIVPVEDGAVSDPEPNTTRTTSAPPVSISNEIPAQLRRVSIDTVTPKSRGKVASASPVSPVSPAPYSPRRRRRLSKSRPASIDGSGVKTSIETVRPQRPSTATAVTVPTTRDPRPPTGDTTQNNDTEAIVVPPPSNESMPRTRRKLNKNPDSRRPVATQQPVPTPMKPKSNHKGRWILRLASKIPRLATD